MKFVFVANNNAGGGLSGGDRIFIEFIKSWQENNEILLFGSEEAMNISRDRGVKNIRIIKTANLNPQNITLSDLAFLKHIIVRSYCGLKAISENLKEIKSANFIYSVSDFYPDLLPAFYAKLKNPGLKWIAGFYLFAPSPFSKSSPYGRFSFLKGFCYWFLQRLSFFIVKRYADIVFVTSKPDVNKFITQKRKENKIIVVQGGVDLTEAKKYFISKEKIPIKKRKWDVCFVGRLHYQKGVLELIEIWGKVCSTVRLAKLAIIGDGPLEQELREKIIQLNLEKNIDLLGFKDGKDKYEIYKQSKVMVHPATYDSGGMAMAEGMAWGLPGVSFDLESLSEYYSKGVLKSKVGDLRDFAGKIIRLLKDEPFYDKIADEAKKFSLTWDWEKRAQKILKLLKEG